MRLVRESTNSPEKYHDLFFFICQDYNFNILSNQY
jgi:hypothetical protein